MIFLLRMVFWLGVVLVLLPVGGAKDNSAPKVNAGEAVTAALGTVSDLRDFCGRQPEACVFGSHAAAAIGERAQTNAKLLYEFITQRIAAKGGAPNNADTSAARTAGVPLPTARPNNDTLAPGDLGPNWRGPNEAGPARHARRTEP